MIGIVAGLALVAAFAGIAMWFRGQGKTPETQEERAYREFLITTAKGHLGKLRSGTAGKEWAGYVPFFRQGALQVYAPQAVCHGEERRPVFLLIERLAFGVPYIMGSGLESDGSSLKFNLSQNDASGKPFPVEWRAVGVPEGQIRFPATPRFSEAITLGGKPYSLEKGRVFLVNLSEAPPVVTQVDADLIDLFQGAGEEITREELEDIVERLMGLAQAVKAFLDDVPKP
jgi:hypothetical protein